MIMPGHATRVTIAPACCITTLCTLLHAMATVFSFIFILELGPIATPAHFSDTGPGVNKEAIHCTAKCTKEVQHVRGEYSAELGGILYSTKHCWNMLVLK